MSILLKRGVRNFSVQTNASCHALDDKYMAHNYATLPPVIVRGERHFVWDVEGNKYTDFHSGYCAVNQGHCHPRIVKTLTEQAAKLTMCSRTFNNANSGEYAKYMHETFGYDKVLPMNSGVEACETAIKIARRWGYVVKGVEANKATVIVCNGCFWGRSITASGACDDPVRYTNFGPFTPGFELIDFNALDQLEQKFKENPNIVAFMVEPIQGEAGCVIPDKDYLRKAKALCEKYNVLLYCDEIQTGIGRTGKMMQYEYSGIKPDIVSLGKSLSGGLMPISAVLANDEIMMTIKPGDHGSTFGGNALACAVAQTALQVIKDEGMIENAKEMGDYLVKSLNDSIDSPIFKEARGSGLFCSIEMNGTGYGKKVSQSMFAKGFVCKDTHDTVVRLAPPLTIGKEDISKAIDALTQTIKEVASS